MSKVEKIKGWGSQTHDLVGGFKDERFTQDLLIH